MVVLLSGGEHKASCVCRGCGLLKQLDGAEGKGDMMKMKCRNMQGRKSSVGRYKFVLVYSVCQCLRDYIKYFVLNIPTANLTLNSHAYISAAINCCGCTVLQFIKWRFYRSSQQWTFGTETTRLVAITAGWQADIPTGRIAPHRTYVMSSRKLRAMWLQDVTSWS